ncbi:hypothetical protein OK016_04695 [Vibrio chagasii]|nr:hypothetical protein [Vibrio chagasii]
MRNLTILLGATGLIGASTLKVVEQNPDLYSVVALAAGLNAEKMLALVEKWQPSYVAMACPTLISACWTPCYSSITPNVQVLSGSEGTLCKVASLGEVGHGDGCDCWRGRSGLTMSAVKVGKGILSNKEAFVMPAGQSFIDAVEKYGAELLPKR